MKSQIRSYVALLLIVVFTIPIFAQSVPDRSANVKQLLETKYRGMLNGEDDRGREVLGMVCGDLNLLDNGQWGQLIKNDRNPPFIPYDILVWKPTREHVDVLSGFAAVWIVHEAIPSAWNWLPCSSILPPVVNPPVPPTPMPPSMDLSEVIRREIILENELLIIKADGKQTQLLTQEAVIQIKEHRASVSREYYKWAAILGPVITGITVWVQTKTRVQ